MSSPACSANWRSRHRQAGKLTGFRTHYPFSKCDPRSGYYETLTRLRVSLIIQSKFQVWALARNDLNSFTMRSSLMPNSIHRIKPRSADSRIGSKNNTHQQGNDSDDKKGIQCIVRLKRHLGNRGNNRNYNHGT